MTQFQTPADLADPRGVFLNFLKNQGINPFGQFGQIQQQFQNPLLSAFSLQSLLGGGQGPQDIASYLGQTGGPRAAGGVARQNLRQIAGYGGQQVSEGTPNASFLNELIGATPENEAGQDVQNAARLGLFNKLSPFVAGRYSSNLLNNANDLYSQSRATAAGNAGANAPDYVSSLLRTLGL